jgi:predicted O-methyltransferase YrrM
MVPLFVQKMHNRLRRSLWRLPLSVVPAPFRAEVKRDTTIAAEIASYEKSAGFAHGAGSLPLRTLLRIEQLLSATQISSAETGCGKSTIFLSRISKRHRVFCLDDRDACDASSVSYFMNCPATRIESIETIFGPTQATLPTYKDHVPYDLVLIDGPHGFPFPELEYYFFYPHLKTNGLLVIDDIHIPTIGRLADFISEDRMFEIVECISATAVFRRTDAPVFDPFGDGWWLQDYNRRRADFSKHNHLQDGNRRKPITFEGRF